MMPLYALVFVGTTALTIVVLLQLGPDGGPGSKWVHLSIGVIAVVFGTSLLLLANAWSVFDDGAVGS